MIRTGIAIGLIIAGSTVASLPALAQKDSDKCHNAWEDRNAVYKAKNYCFKTQKALSWFGPNAPDCKANVNLSASDWRKINEAKAREQLYC